MIGETLQVLILASTVFVGSTLNTAFMKHLCARYGWLSPPRPDRWHKSPTALHGGVGFYPVFLLGACWILMRQYGEIASDWFSGGALPKELTLASTLLLGSFLLFVFGLWDDIRRFRPATKLLCELIAASMFIFAGGIFPLTGSDALDLLITYFWFVGITNAVNMLDNMDGLASGVVMLAAITLVILGVPLTDNDNHAPLVVLLGLLFVASLGGFWIHNRPPASIFMGDSGSLSIGYLLAGMAVPTQLNGFMGLNSGGTVWGAALVLLIPAVVLAVPIFDTTLVTITRKWRAQKASQGGRDHSSHRLVGLGLSETKTVWILYGFAALGGSVAVVVQRVPELAMPLLGFYVLILLLSGTYLGHVKVQAVQSNRRPPAWTPLVTEIFYKRRAAEVLLDTVLIVISFYGAHLLRFEGMISRSTQDAIVESLPIVVASSLATYFLVGIYRGQWRLISVSDVPSYVLGVFGGAGISLAVVTLATRFDAGHSRSAYIIYGLVSFIGIVGSRLSFRLLDAVLLVNGRDTEGKESKPVLIYGAGRAGKLLHEEFLCNPALRNYVLLGFIDDDPNCVGRKLCGAPVKQAQEWCRQLRDRAPEIWISSRYISDDRAQELARLWRSDVRISRLRLQMEAVGHSHLDVDPEILAQTEDGG